MKNQKKIKRRLLRSYLVVTISVALVLFMVGLISIMLLNTDKISDYVRENVGFTLILDEEIKEIEIIQLQKNLNASEFVKSATYVDKESASEELTKDLGEDFIGFLGYNPLFASVDVKLRAAWLQPDSIRKIEKRFLEFPQVREVFFQRDLVQVIHKNIQNLYIIMTLISGLFLIIFMALISNTIRLSIYSQRFDINTMKLVGATYNFIRRPFVMKIMTCGLIAAIVANICIFLIVIYLRQYAYEFVDLLRFESIGFTLIIVFIFGIVISYMAATFAVNKYLKLSYDDLFW